MQECRQLQALLQIVRLFSVGEFSWRLYKLFRKRIMILLTNVLRITREQMMDAHSICSTLFLFYYPCHKKVASADGIGRQLDLLVLEKLEAR